MKRMEFELITNVYGDASYPDVVYFTIKFKYHGMDLSLCPESPEIFWNSEFITNTSGDFVFDSQPGNGEFDITLDDNFTINVAKYGDGQAGSLSISVERTPQISEDFSKIVKEISDYMNSHKESFCFHMINNWK